MAIALDTRRAGPALCMNMNGITTGNVETNTIRNTPIAPSQSSLPRCARCGGSGSCINRWRIVSSSAGSRIDATTGGNASAMRRWACCGSVALRTARYVMRPRPFSARQPIRYNIASMMPQAMLHPSAPMSIDANIVAAGLGDAQRTGEREHHDQAEQDFGDALDRLQDARRAAAHATRGGNR